MLARSPVLVAVAVGTIVIGVASSGATPPAMVAAAGIIQTWHSDLRRGALADPKRRFPNPSRATLVARLNRAGVRFEFRVVKIEIFHPRQSAPLVVVQTSNRRAFASATGAILRRIDPKLRTNDDRTGWAYEGFLFEALDDRGVPFLITFNSLRGLHAGGGQWASSPSLFPFAHG